jgi:DNA-binding PadR family transcriptional regulator
MDSAGMNDSELTILSLLAEADRSDTEISQLIETRGLRAWVNIGLSSIFYVLGQLERHGLIRSQMRPDPHGVARQFFSLTDAGRGVLQTAVADLLRQPRALGDGFELGLANLHVLKPHQVYQNLSHHRSDLELRLALIESARAGIDGHQSGDIDAVDAMYSHSATLMRAELDWLTAFLADWVKRYPASAERTAGSKAAPDAPDAHSAPTRSMRVPTPNPVKQVQKLKRPKRD